LARAVRVHRLGRGPPLAHTTHLAGSRYQIRYIRGTHGRDQGTEKSAFDPW